MEEEKQQDGNEGFPEHMETKHRPHPHALRRILIGVGAVLCIVLGGVVWANWGSDIKEACFGDGEVCAVDLPETPSAN